MATNTGLRIEAVHDMRASVDPRGFPLACNRHMHLSLHMQLRDKTTYSTAADF